MARKRQTSQDQLVLHIHALYHGAGIVGPGLKPWGTVAELALVLHDYVESGEAFEPFHERKRNPATRKLEWVPRIGGEEFERHERLRHMLRLMVQLAHRHVMDRRLPSMRTRWDSWAAHGIVWTYPTGGGGEHHATCVWCRTDLATMGRGSHKINRSILDRWERHTFVCAMRELAPELAEYREHSKEPAP